MQMIWVATLTLIVLLIIFLLHALYQIIKLSRLKAKRAEQEKDFQAISGENLQGTKLDLAQAYLDMDEKILAKKLLLEILQEGSSIERQEAKRLLTLIVEG